MSDEKPALREYERRASDVATWRRRAEQLASYVLGCEDSVAAGAHRIVIGNCHGYMWEPEGHAPDQRANRTASAEVPAVPAVSADPAALIRAAIAQQVRRSACDPAGLLTLAHALEAVNRASGGEW